MKLNPMRFFSELSSTALNEFYSQVNMHWIADLFLSRKNFLINKIFKQLWHLYLKGVLQSTLDISFIFLLHKPVDQTKSYSFIGLQFTRERFSPVFLNQWFRCTKVVVSCGIHRTLVLCCPAVKPGMWHMQDTEVGRLSSMGRASKYDFPYLERASVHPDPLTGVLLHWIWPPNPEVSSDDVIPSYFQFYFE